MAAAILAASAAIFLPAAASARPSVDSRGWQAFPDSDWRIRLDVQQKNGTLWVWTSGIGHGRQSASFSHRPDRPFFEELLSQAAPAWRAVRIFGGECNGHVFQQQLLYGRTVPGSFVPFLREAGDKPYVRLTPADHGHFYCFQVRGPGGKYVYLLSPQPVYMRHPELAEPPKQGFWGEKFSWGTDSEFDLSFIDPETWRPDDEYPLEVEAVTYRPEILPVYRNLGLRAIPTECSRRLFEALSNLGVEVVSGRPWHSPGNDFIHVSIPVRPADIGKRLCVRAAWSQLPDEAAYILTDVARTAPPARRPLPSTRELPPRFGLAEALAIFRQQLTPAGRDLLDEISVLAVDGKDSQGTFYSASAEIELSAGLFPDRYPDWSQATKLQIIKTAVQVIAHEYMHAVGYQVGLYDHLAECRATVSDDWRERQPLPASNVADALAEVLNDLPDIYYVLDMDWAEVAIDDSQDERLYRQFWQDHDGCLASHPSVGFIYEALKRERLRFDRFPVYDGSVDPVQWLRLTAMLDAELVWGRLSHYDSTYIGGEHWYGELHSELPLVASRLPARLEEHYGRFFKDRRDFVRGLLAPDALWD